jgi:hypothetical protein
MLPPPHRTWPTDEGFLFEFPEIASRVTLDLVVTRAGPVTVARWVDRRGRVWRVATGGEC